LVGLSFGNVIAVHYKLVIIVILFINLLGLQKANSDPSKEAFLPDMPMALDDKIWMHQQLENLKSIEFLNHDTLTSDNHHDGTALNKTPQLTPQSSSRLLIFISFSMPKESLKALARQAKKAGGTLVLRGLVDDSLKKTLASVIEILGADDLGDLSIDPMAFRTFGIHAVPAMVVAASSQKFDVIYGDVSLSYALKKMVDGGEESQLAQSYLSRLGT